MCGGCFPREFFEQDQNHSRNQNGFCCCSTVSVDAKYDSFGWTDAEIELLLDVIKQFQPDRQFEGVDWESVKSKYGKIKDMLLERYLTSGKPEDFPKNKSCLHGLITKDRIAAKVKTIRKNYKKAVDRGRRSSGGGRVACTFYDLCNDIWSGSPATQGIDSE